MNDKNNINDLLADVRYAYRLLFQFQSRILNLCQIIGNSYNMNYSGGYPKFSSASPRVGKGNLNNWAWDWLNMYYYEFHFKGSAVNGEKLNFAIFLLSDTGYFTYHSERKGNTWHNEEQKEVEKFTSVKNSESTLIFQLGYTDAWDAKALDSDFTNAEEGTWLCNGKKIIFKHYPLEEFVDEDSTMKALLDFREFAKTHGFILQDTQVFS